MSEELNFLDLEDLSYLQIINHTSIQSKSPSLAFFQLNQRRSEIVDQCTRNYVEKHNDHNTDMPLICLLQEPYYFKQGTFYGPNPSYDSIYFSQPGKRARTAIWCPKLFNPRPVYQIMSEDIAAAVISFCGSSFLIISIYNPQAAIPPNSSPRLKATSPLNIYLVP